MKTRLPRSSFHHAVVTFFGSLPLDLAGERERGAPNDRELPVRLDPAEDVDPAVPGGLRPARVADLGEHLAHERGDLLPVAERRPGLRVDVDPQLVRMLRVAAARRPRMEVDDGEVRRPDHLRELGHAQLVGVTPGREGHARRLDPLRPLLGNALLVDRLAGDAVREAAELRRALVQRAHDPLSDGEVVLGEVALRLARLREEHLVGVRQLDDPLPHLELDERTCHDSATAAAKQLRFRFPRSKPRLSGFRAADALAMRGTLAAR